jgi:hypothetical protein
MSYNSDFDSISKDIWTCYTEDVITDMQFLTYMRRLKSVYVLLKKVKLV